MQAVSSNALFVIDGSYLLYRSFYAIKPLHTSSGMPTQAIYGFCRAIKKILDDFKPEHLVVVWDSKVKSFRHTQYPAYKATRQKPPSDLFEQKEQIIKFLDIVKIAQVTCDGYEADDIIGGLAKEYKKEQLVLVCPDKDMYQLLSPKLIIFDPFKERIITQESFKTENGFESEKIPFYYALLGDSSDNIPGVAGIGEKTAQKIVMQFKSLDDLYENIDQLALERPKKLILADKENAYLSHKLFLLHPPALETKLSDFTVVATAWANARTFFQELEFSSLVKDIDKRFGQINQQNKPSGQGSLFTQSDEPEADTQTKLPEDAKPKPFKMIVVQDQESFNAMINELKNAPELALDTETTGGMAMQDSLVGISVATTKDHTYYLPLAHIHGQQVDKAQALTALKGILESSKHGIIMHNAKFDEIILQKAGLKLKKVTFDTLLAANLLRKEWEKINLKQLSLTYLNEPMQKFKDVIGKKYKTFAEVPIEDGAGYAAHDALQTLKLKHLFEKELKKEPVLEKIFYEIEMPFAQVLTDMELKGICLDAEKIQATMKLVDHDLVKIESKIHSFVKTLRDEQINLNSPRQVETLLFDDLGLPVVKKSDKGQRSTDQEVLQELSVQHPIPALILKYRELTKLKSTYLEPLPGFINPETGRIHTSFSQTLVATGRLSSSEPNLQNIPTKEGYGMQIRDAFYAPQGKVLLSADYSQIELRIMAFLTQDATLLDVFKHGRDIHAETAAQLFGVSVDAVTHEQRQLGKRINFSIIYGMTPYGLSKDLGISMSDAKTYIQRYFERYPGVLAWMEATVNASIERGYTQTWLGRRRYVKELHERNKALFEQGKRVAINTPVQGTAAELMKLAMIKIHSLFENRKNDAAMLLQIHDEIIIEVDHQALDQVEKIVKKTMENIVDWNVPLTVSLRSGKSWADVSK